MHNNLEKNMTEANMTLGPGGLACPCCHPYHMHPRKSKAKVTRRIRRHFKQELKKEVDREEEI